MPDDNDVPLPVPDPTRLSTEALTRGLKNERDYADGQIAIVLARLGVEREKSNGQHLVTLQRFEDIDKATELLSATVNRVPTDLQTAIKDVIRLMDERDRRVEEHFEAIRTLRLSENALNQTALQAALAAQEKASAVASASLDRTIEKNAELADQAVNALSARVTQVNEQVTRNQQQIAEIQASKVAIAEQKVDTRGGLSSVYGAIGMVVGVVGIVIAAVSIIISSR